MQKKDIIYYLLIIMVVVFMCLVLNFLYKNQKLMRNPFIYGASNMGNVMCSCFQRVHGEMVPFGFNDTTFWTIEQKRIRQEIEINITGLNELRKDNVTLLNEFKEE